MCVCVCVCVSLYMHLDVLDFLFDLLGVSQSVCLSASVSLSLSGEFSVPGYQRAATNLELHNFIPYFGFLSKQKMPKGCLPFALQSVLETLITKCHLTSWDVHGKGKTTTLVLRWDSDNMAATARPDQSESVSFARYRKKSPNELSRDAHRPRTISQTK